MKTCLNALFKAINWSASSIFAVRRKTPCSWMKWMGPWFRLKNISETKKRAQINRKLSCATANTEKRRLCKNEPCRYLSFPLRFVTMDLIFIESVTINLIIIAKVVTTKEHWTIKWILIFLCKLSQFVRTREHHCPQSHMKLKLKHWITT